MHTMYSRQEDARFYKNLRGPTEQKLELSFSNLSISIRISKRPLIGRHASQWEANAPCTWRMCPPGAVQVLWAAEGRPALIYTWSDVTGKWLSWPLGRTRILALVWFSEAEINSNLNFNEYITVISVCLWMLKYRFKRFTEHTYIQ